jgi:hypothetical protein
MSDCEYVVFIDSHMDFEDGWLEKMIAPLEDNYKAIVCSKSVKVNPPHGLKRPGKVLAGAKIREFGTATGRPLEVEWSTEPMQPGPVQCCLGACYAMSANRYDDIGKPWQNAFGWGTSEQTICMINELCGGVNILSDAVTGHYYMDNSDRGFIPDADFKTGALFNRLRLIRMIYGDNSESRIRTDIYRSGYRAYAEKALELLELTDDSEIIRKFTVKMEDYEQKWWPKTQEIEPEKVQIESKNTRDERFV